MDGRRNFHRREKTREPKPNQKLQEDINHLVRYILFQFHIRDKASTNEIFPNLIAESAG
jgi:hypothetical protein